jgi:hypothetical protein
MSHKKALLQWQRETHWSASCFATVPEAVVTVIPLQWSAMIQ